jgi:hypothetical protein
MVQFKKWRTMKNQIIYFVALVFFGGLLSCSPRVELDEGQWGDHAIITNVQVFTLQVAEHELHEFYTSGVLTPARRRSFVSSGNAVIDEDTFTATVVVPSSVDLSRVGIIFYHEAMKIEPLNGAPKAGILTDLSSRSFMYRLYSADGTTHDWEVEIVTE